MMSSVALLALANSEISMHNLRRYALEVTETITARTITGEHVHAISSSEALSIMSECKPIISDVKKLKENVYASLCEFGELCEPSDDEDDSLSHSDIEEVIQLSKSVDNDIKQLRAYLKIAETSPAWSAHAEMLRSLERELSHELSGLRNALTDTAVVMRQFFDTNPTTAEGNITFNEEDVMAFNDAVTCSHERFGLEPPKWL